MQRKDQNTTDGIEFHHRRIPVYLFLLITAMTSALAESLYLQESPFILFFPRWAVYFICLFVLGAGIEKLLHHSDPSENGSKTEALLHYSRKNILRLALLFFTISLLYAVINYPGVCGHDTLNMIRDLITGTKPLPFGWITGQETISVLMNDHHPVFDTLIFTAFYRLGELAGKPNAGIFLYVLIQITVLAVLRAEMILDLSRKGCSPAFCLACVIFFCLPFMSWFSIAVLKDSIFSIIFILYFRVYLSVFYALRADENISRKQWGCLLILSVFAALTNKKGIYIAALSDLTLLFTAKSSGQRVRALLVSLIPVIFMAGVVQRVLFPIFNIYPGGKQEMLGITFQQTARAYIQHPESFTESDKEILKHILSIDPDQYITIYEDASTDTLKSKYNFYAAGSEILDFLKLWGRMGLKHPLEYLKAVMKICAGYFAPFKTINIYTAMPHVKNVRLGQHELLKEPRAILSDLYNWMAKVPGISLLFRDALYSFWLPALTVFLLLKRGRPKEIPVLIPILINILFLIVGPVCWTRYALCQLYTIPMQLSILCRQTGSDIPS